MILALENQKLVKVSLLESENTFLLVSLSSYYFIATVLLSFTVAVQQ